MRFWDLPLPNKLDGLGNPWVQAVVDGTTQCGRFQQFSLRMIPGKWNGDFRFKCDNSPRRIATHFFGCFDLHALKVDRVSLCGNPHNRGHACCQSSRDEIGRRKRFPFSFIIDGSIGFQFGTRRAVKRRAVQLPFVPNGNFYQSLASPALRQGSVPIPQPCPKGT